MNEMCHDCGAKPGEKHLDGCDVARCLVTGGQRLSCNGRKHDCGEDVWTGEWPGDADARELGFFCYWDGAEWPNNSPGNGGWVSCSADHPKARPDLNRLAMEARWDIEQKRWVAR